MNCINKLCLALFLSFFPLSPTLYLLDFAVTPQPNLYPTVGLQTPGEIVDANFGQHPFVFDIEDYMSEWRAKIHGMIARFPIGERLGEWQAVLQKYVSLHEEYNFLSGKKCHTSIRVVCHNICEIPCTLRYSFT